MARVSLRPTFTIDRPPRSILEDCIAGLVLTAFLVPVGMGYAQASGIAPVHGLYATIVPLIVYALVGRSKVLILGPDSSLAPIIAATILPLAAGDPDRAVALAGAVAVGSGLICLAAGFAHFGFLSELLSMPVRYGYLNGIALAVILGQLPTMLGLATDATSSLGRLADAVRGVLDTDVDLSTFALTVAAVAVTIGARRFDRRIPGVLLAIVVATAAVTAFNLDVAVVGALPQGLPSPKVPAIDRDDIAALVAGSATLAIVTFTDTGMLSKAYALRRNEPVDTNHELLALGAANLATGLAQGFPVSASSSRTPVAESAGARTQLTGIVAALAVAVVLILAPGLFENLPLAALSAVVVVAVLSLFEIRAVFRLLRERPTEFWLSVTATFGVVLFGALWGVGLAVLMSLIVFVERARRPHATNLVRIEGRKGYHDARRHREGKLIDGLLLYRFDAPLFFANADHFRADLLEHIERSPTPVEWVTVTAEPITGIDATADAMLRDLVDELASRGIVLTFAELKGVVRDGLDRAGTVDAIGPENFFPTIGRAVDAFVKRTGSQWIDWQDR